MSKHPVSKSKPVKRNEPMRSALIFFLAGCVAELYLLVIRRFYVNGTAEQLVACDDALPYVMGVGAAVALVGLILGIVWRKEKNAPLDRLVRVCRRRVSGRLRLDDQGLL